MLVLKLFNMVHFFQVKNTQKILGDFLKAFNVLWWLKAARNFLQPLTHSHIKPKPSS